MKCIFCDKNLKGVVRKHLAHCSLCEKSKPRRLKYVAKKLGLGATEMQINVEHDKLFAFRNTDLKEEILRCNSKLHKLIDGILNDAGKLS